MAMLLNQNLIENGRRGARQGQCARRKMMTVVE
jgi:hypothetical protein